jgi:(p)ppGpp synthase/HD superfamily hydrolase
MSGELPESAQRIQKAVDFAVKYHRMQFRKASHLPYISHPFDVLKTIARWGVSNATHPDVWDAVLLHDTLEDTQATYDLLAREFGAAVAEQVKNLTFSPRLPQEPAANYQVRKSEHLKEFIHKPPEAIVVKSADRNCNVWDFFHGGDAAYACEYFQKANGLWIAVKERRSDIETNFGPAVWSNMTSSIEHQARIVGAPDPF